MKLPSRRTRHEIISTCADDLRVSTATGRERAFLKDLIKATTLPTGRGTDPSAQVDEDFTPHVNTKFRTRLGDAPAMEIELIGAEDKSPLARQEQFVLTFLAPREAPARQSLFEVEHEHLGSGAIFLVPIAKDERGVSFEAIFNRKREVAD